MADVSFKQELKITAGLANPTAPTSIQEKDFEISTNVTLNDYNETQKLRFIIPDGTIDQSICMGTVAEGQVLAIYPDNSNIKVKITNSEGTSQDIEFKSGIWSVLHVKFTQLLFTNDFGVETKGSLFIAGD